MSVRADVSMCPGSSAAARRCRPSPMTGEVAEMNVLAAPSACGLPARSPGIVRVVVGVERRLRASRSRPRGCRRTRRRRPGGSPRYSATTPVSIRRVEARRVTDLEGEAEAAGVPVGPVLDRAGGVVELVRRPSWRSRWRRSSVAPSALYARLVGAQAGAVEGRRPQHQVAVGVVGDQVGDLAVGDQVPDVVDLGLGAGAVTAVGVVGPVGAGAAAAPEAGVVAVEVGAAQPPGGVVVAGAAAVLRRRVRRRRLQFFRFIS